MIKIMHFNFSKLIQCYENEPILNFLGIYYLCNVPIGFINISKCLIFQR